MKLRHFAKKAAAPLLAAVLVLGAGAGTSSSYFTTYVTALGGWTLELKDVRVIPHEKVEGNVKNITVENTGDAPCYVRVRVVASGQVKAEYIGTGWTDYGDGYLYYDEILPVGASTNTLEAHLSIPTEFEGRPIPEGTEINVEVIAECTKVLYDETGAPYANWDLVVKEG